MRKLTLLTSLALIAVIPAVAGGHTPSSAKTYTVKVGDDFFSPTKRTIHKRDIVKWVWVGENGKAGQTINEHTVVESKDRFQSATKTEGTFKFRFKKAGKFTIYCAEHTDKMKLTVRVVE
jgi:plastocyanin